MMMRILMVSALAAVCGLAEEPKKSTVAPKKAPAKSTASKTTTKSAKTAKKPAPSTQTVPAGAKEIEPGTYRWVDPKGVAWIYTKTPFGLMKGPEKKNEMPDGAATAGWRVTDLGENLEFEKPYPFGGTYRWTRKKTELTDLESEFWQRSQATAQNK